MKRVLFALFFSVLTGLVFADSKIDRIALINIQQVMEVVFADKSTLIQGIKDEKNKMQENLNKLKDTWMKLEQDKLNEKDNSKIFSHNTKIDELKKQYSDYYKTTSYQIDQKIKTMQEPYFKEIYNVVRKICESQGYSIVLDIKTDGVFYYSTDNDITQKVIDFFKVEETN